MSLTWKFKPIPGTMLTDLESVFRSLKSEFELRPVYHRKKGWVDGHLFSTVLAYQAVQVLRHKPKSDGINESRVSLQSTLSAQRRITVTFQRRDGRTLHIRKNTQPEPKLVKLYTSLGLPPDPGGIKKMIHEPKKCNL